MRKPFINTKKLRADVDITAEYPIAMSETCFTAKEAEKLIIFLKQALKYLKRKRRS